MAKKEGRIDKRKLAAKMALLEMSRRELAEKAGVSYDTIGNLFSQGNPAYHVIVSVSEALELTAQEMLEIFFDEYLRKCKNRSTA